MFSTYINLGARTAIAATLRRNLQHPRLIDGGAVQIGFLELSTPIDVCIAFVVRELPRGVEIGETSSKIQVTIVPQSEERLIFY